MWRGWGCPTSWRYTVHTVHERCFVVGWGCAYQVFVLVIIFAWPSAMNMHSFALMDPNRHILRTNWRKLERWALNDTGNEWFREQGQSSDQLNLFGQSAYAEGWQSRVILDASSPHSSWLLEWLIPFRPGTFLIILITFSAHAYQLASPSCTAHIHSLDVGIYHWRYESDDPVFAAG